MKQLWVRFSLIIGSVIMIVAVLPTVIFAVMLRYNKLPMRANLLEIIPLEPNEFETIRTIILRAVSQDVFSGIAISGVVGVIVGISLSRMVARPLTMLEDGAKAIAGGDFAHRVDVSGSEEMRSVGVAFNEMARKLEEAERLRSNLLADVAHELRHPLQILRGNLQAILDGVYELEMEEIGRLFQQTQHLTRLINDLHELAQAEAQQLPLTLQGVEVGKLVRDVVDIYQPMAASQQVCLQMAPLGRPVAISADASRLRQALSNLLHNALQHTPANGEIAVAVVENAGQVEIMVRDSGKGISAEQLPHVFDRFYRGDLSRSRTSSGTGLGLAIAQAITVAHHGQIHVTSDGLNRGSQFVLRLPKTTNGTS
jgi:signal transduction histidine kinase